MAVVGVRAINSMPLAARATKTKTLAPYDTVCMKYGASNLTTNVGKTSANRTVPAPTVEPTRSTAAERIIT